jgi:hypothetical protein
MRCARVMRYLQVTIISRCKLCRWHEQVLIPSPRFPLTFEHSGNPSEWFLKLVKLSTSNIRRQSHIYSYSLANNRIVFMQHILSSSTPWIPLRQPVDCSIVPWHGNTNTIGREARTDSISPRRHKLK